jgi:molybdate/tungstate transport system permease protein
MVLTALVFLPILVAVMGESLANIQPVLEDGRVRSAIAVTFLTATVSTVILLLFVVPLAYGISRLRFFGRTALLSLIDLPVVIPQSVAGIALVSVLGRNQYLGELVFRLTGVAVDNTILGIIVAQVVVSLPFIAKASIAAFDAVPEELETVARTLKASSFGAFRRVALPLASRGIFFGAVLAWARAAGEFGAVVILAPTPVTAPVEAFNRFVSVGAIEAAPLVTVLLAFSFVMFFLLQWSVRLLPAGAAGGGR